MAQRNLRWRSALHHEIERHRREPFSWETGADCAMFAADCVKAMTGEDPAKDFRGKYTSAEGALRAMRRAGFSDLGTLIGSMFEEIHPAKARVGDVGAIPSDGPFGMTLGVVIGERVATRLPEGIGSVARHELVRAFRIP